MSEIEREIQSAPKHKKRRRKGRRTLHHIMLILLVLVVGVVLSLTVFFKIEEISVDGIDHYTDEEVVTATGLVLESNLFLADLDSARDKLMTTFPYIEEATVKMGLPPKIEINLYASVPAAALEYGDHEYALITSSGKVLEKGLVLLPAEVLLVRGVEVGNKVPGDYLGRFKKEEIPTDSSETLTADIVEKNRVAQLVAEDEMDALYVINYMIEAIHITGFNAVTNVDLTNPLDMRIVYENRLLLKLGTELNLEYKLRALQRTIELQHPKAHGTFNVENLTGTAQTIFTPAEGYDRDGVPLGERDEEKDAELVDPMGGESPEGDTDPSLEVSETDTVEQPIEEANPSTVIEEEAPAEEMG